MSDNLAHFVEGVGGDVVILTNQVRDSFQQLHKIQLLLVAPTLIRAVFAKNVKNKLKWLNLLMKRKRMTDLISLIIFKF